MTAALYEGDRHQKGKTADFFFLSKCSYQTKFIFCVLMKCTNKSTAKCFAWVWGFVKGDNLCFQIQWKLLTWGFCCVWREFNFSMRSVKPAMIQWNLCGTFYSRTSFVDHDQFEGYYRNRHTEVMLFSGFFDWLKFVLYVWMLQENRWSCELGKKGSK